MNNSLPASGRRHLPASHARRARWWTPFRFLWDIEASERGEMQKVFKTIHPNSIKRREIGWTMLYIYFYVKNASCVWCVFFILHLYEIMKSGTVFINKFCKDIIEELKNNYCFCCESPTHISSRSLLHLRTWNTQMLWRLITQKVNYQTE